MSEKPKDLVLQGGEKPQELVARKGGSDLAARKEELRLKSVERGVEATADIVKLLVRGGNVFVDSKERRDITASEWDATHRRIAELDNATANELKKLAAAMETHKEKTERLRMVLDVIATRGDVLSVVLSKGLAKAVEQLTLG